jgi:integrase
MTSSFPSHSLTTLGPKKPGQVTSDAAELGDLHFHDLRGTAITMLSEAGCTTPEIAAITGHSVRNIASIIDVYLARTRPLADNAIAKLEAHRVFQTNPK